MSSITTTDLYEYLKNCQKISDPNINSKLILIFAEDFVMLNVALLCETKDPQHYADLSWRLKLSRTGDLFLFVKDNDFPVKLPPSCVEISLDRDWATRTPLDPSIPENHKLIMQALVDFGEGIPNPLNTTEDDFQPVNWTFRELAQNLNVSQELILDQYIAYQIIEA